MTFGFCEQGGGTDAESLCDSGQSQNGDVPLRPLDHADVGPVQFGLLGQLFLTQADPLSCGPDCASQGDTEGGLSHSLRLGI